MRTSLVFLAILFLSGQTPAQSEKPILVLDSGGHTGLIWDAVYLPGGEEAVTISYDKTVRLWDLKNGQSIRSLRVPVSAGTDGRLIGAAVSPDGKTLAVSGTGTGNYKNPIYLISLISGKITKVLQGHTGNANTVAFSPDGTRLASSANDKTARIWDVATGRQIHLLAGHEAVCVNSIVFSADGKKVGTAGLDKTARIWSVETGALLQTLKHLGGVLYLSFQPDGNRVATLAGSSLCFWNAQGKFEKEYDLGGQLTLCRYSLDGKQILVTGFRTGMVDPATGRMTRFTQEYSTGGDLTANGRRALTVDSNGFLREWDTASGKLLQTLRSPSDPVWSAAWSDSNLAFGNQGSLDDQAFNPEFKLTRAFNVNELEFTELSKNIRRGSANSSGRTLKRNAERQVEYFEKGQRVRAFQLPNLGTGFGSITSMTFLGSRYAAVGDGNGQMFRIDLSTGSVKEWKGHNGTIWSLAPSPDDRYVLSASTDHTLKIWSPEFDEPLLSLFIAGSEWVAWTPEGYFAASPGGEKFMGWQINNGPDQMASFYSADKFRKSLHKPEVIKQLLTAGSLKKALEIVNAKGNKKTEATEVSNILPPKVRITTPAASLSLQDSSLEVRARAESVGVHPVKSLQLLMNGRPVGQTFKVDVPKLGDVAASWTVSLAPGKQHLTVRAESAVSSALSEEIVVNRVVPNPDEQIRLPSLYILAIGISDYPGDLKLHYAAKDAGLFARTFQTHSKALFEKIEVKELTNEKATRGEILKGITWLQKQATQRDIVILFMAGHGEVSNTGAFYYLPADVDPDDITSSGVPGEQLKERLAGFPCRVMFFLDACHAGGVDGGVKKRNANSLTDDLIRDLVTDERGVVALCASTGRQFALESNEHKHGLFTLALIEGLQGKAQKTADGAVFLHHLDAYVTDRVKELSAGRQSPTTARPASVRSFPLSKP